MRTTDKNNPTFAAGPIGHIIAHNGNINAYLYSTTTGLMYKTKDLGPLFGFCLEPTNLISVHTGCFVRNCYNALNNDLFNNLPTD